MTAHVGWALLIAVIAAIGFAASRSGEERRGASRDQDGQMAEARRASGGWMYVYGKAFSDRRKAVRYMWRVRAFAASGWLLALALAGLLAYGRWIA